MATFIFDLDGTLANCDHRMEHAYTKDWDTFQSLAHLDTSYPNICKLLDHLSGEIIIVTGRNEKYREPTISWLSKNMIDADCVLMRPDGDWRKDAEMKIDIISQHFGSLQEALNEVVCVFEDRDSMVEGLRNVGFTVAQVRNGTY